MAIVNVVALAEGFYDGHRRRVGSVFKMDDSKWKKHKAATETAKVGDPRVPSWVRVVANEAEGKRAAAAAVQAEQDKRKAGAIAASGGKAAREKSDEVSKLIG